MRTHGENSGKMFTWFLAPREVFQMLDVLLSLGDLIFVFTNNSKLPALSRRYVCVLVFVFQPWRCVITG